MEVEKLSTDKGSLGVLMGNQRIQRIGKMMVEHMADGKPTANRHAQRLQEKFEKQGIRSREDLYKRAENNGTMRLAEDLQFGNNSVLYTTAVASFIEKALRSELVTKGIIKKLNLPPGADDIDVPKGSNRTASAVSSDGSVSLSSSDYGSLNIQTDLYGARDKVTHELLQVTTIDVMADLLEEIGYAIALKEDDVILSELQDVTDPTSGTYGDNSNYNYLGSATTISYDALIKSIHSAKSNKMNPTDMIAGTTFMQNLEQDDEFTDAANFGTTQAGDYIPQTATIRGIRVHESANVAADSAFLIDRNRFGYFVEGGGVDTWDARVNGEAAFEILGVKRFGVGITRPKSVYGIHESEDKPT